MSEREGASPFDGGDDGDNGTLTAAPAAPPGGTGSDARGVDIPASLYDRFEQFELIGRGGMGAVYRAHDFRLRRTVAVKLLFEGDSSSQTGFLQEARSQARLLHPRVCEVFEAGVADHVPFIVMRHVDGPPLHRAEPPMTIEEKVRVLREIALALHEAHRLGMVHRDVKPGNILVERGEDGAWKPYIADFGIARDVGDGIAGQGHGVQGTPAFMAPEQAAGKVGAIDRRTDVYGLGATLYALLAGQPPFRAPDLPALLRMVREEAPPSLLAALPSTPADLDAIAMKCLEKDPAARYESARALGEDLQRFLDGDPVAARPRSLGVRLWKRARKNKRKVAAGGLALVAALMLAGFWLHSLRVAAERELLAREMGGAVREMELFLRSAHTLPLHDVELERDVLRARLTVIAARTSAAGDVGVGPGEDAQGRGALALQDAAGAMAHFAKAAATGYQAPGFDYSMGLAQIELYRQALEQTSHIQKESDKQARIAEIERQYKAPALVHLRAALAEGVESPAYAMGLVGLHEGHLDEALARAREAFAAAPWLYEAKKLEGDVLFAMGRLTGHDKVVDYERTHGYFERAATAYHAAADVARSDPAVHEAECELWIQAMNAAGEHDAPMRPGFDQARSACERAIAASPRRPSGYLKLAFAHSCFAYWVANGSHEGESPELVLAQAALRVEAAVRQSPGEAFASYLVGTVSRSRALYLVQLGRDAGPAIDQAIAGYESALKLDPTMVWALNEQCGTFMMRGTREAWLGIDPGGSFEQALSRCGRAMALDPDFMFPNVGLIEAHLFDAERLVAAGRSPQAAVARGLLAVSAAEKKYPTWPLIPYWRVGLHRAEAEYAIASGEDPGAALGRAGASEARLVALGDSLSDGAGALGEIALVTAEAQLVRLETAPGRPGASPELEAVLGRAREAFTRARAEAPWDIVGACWLARTLLTELRYRLLLGQGTLAQGEAALAPLEPFLAEPRVDPRLYGIAARVREARAALRNHLGQDPKAELDSGIALAERAVAVGPGIETGRAALGRLCLLRARAERDPAQKKEWARRAEQALAAAVGASPLLGRTHATLLGEASRLAARD